jgi:hypothetical protein
MQNDTKITTQRMAARIILFFIELFASSSYFTNPQQIGASNGFIAYVLI